MGVGVLFAMTGFLITSHLTKKIPPTSRLSLSTFYARQIKLLPTATFIVLVASPLAVVLSVP